MHPCVYYYSMIETTKQLITQLKNDFRLYDYKIDRI